MAKIYESLLSKNILREKRCDTFDPKRVTMLGVESICMANLQEILRVIVLFFITSLTFFGFFQKRSFVLSSEHENQNVATIVTLLDQFMLICK